MATYDLLYIGLIGLVIFLLFKAVSRLFHYKTEEKSIEKAQGKTVFFFLSYHWSTRIIANSIMVWALLLQPFSKGGVYITILIVLYAVYTLIIIAKWPLEIVRISKDSLNFRFRKPRSLKEIKAISVDHDRLVIHAKSHPKKTKLIKGRFKGDWEVLQSSVLEFVSQNPEIVIKGTPAQVGKTEV